MPLGKVTKYRIGFLGYFATRIGINFSSHFSIKIPQHEFEKKFNEVERTKYSCHLRSTFEIKSVSRCISK